MMDAERHDSAGPSHSEDDDGVANSSMDLFDPDSDEDMVCQFNTKSAPVLLPSATQTVELEPEKSSQVRSKRICLKPSADVAIEGSSVDVPSLGKEAQVKVCEISPEISIDDGKPSRHDDVTSDDEIVLSDDELLNGVCLMEGQMDSNHPQCPNIVFLKELSPTANVSTQINKGQNSLWSSSSSSSPKCNYVEDCSVPRNVKEKAAEATHSSHTLSIASLETDGRNSSVIICEPQTDFVCPFCEVNFEDAVVLFDHVNSFHQDVAHNDTTLACPLCSFRCNFEHDMLSHVALHETEATVHAVSPQAVSPHREETSLSCPMCGRHMSDPDLLTSHVETHFSPQHSPHVTPPRASARQSPKPATGRESLNKENWQAAQASSSSSSCESGSYHRQYERGLERALMKDQISTAQYHELKSRASRVDVRDIDDGSTRMTGLVEKIDSLFARKSRQNQAVFLSSPTDHFSGSYGDKGWGCGYRNFQMMLSCLLRHPEYAQTLAPMTLEAVPSIPRLQSLIEEAWHKGFDPQGCRQLGGKLARTRKWIGATEVVATLASLRIKCRLVDFHTPSCSGSHPALMQWACDYFTGPSHHRHHRPPLYLQYQGHSWTVVGVERERGEAKLVLFDPGNPNLATLARADLTWKDYAQTFRRSQSRFKSRQYQIVAVVGVLRSEQDYEKSKILTSERIP